MAGKFYGNYEGLDERRKQERADSAMMGSMVSSHANMPQDLVIKNYPKNNGAMPEGLDDTISGIDGQISADNSKKNSKMKPKKV
jgi:hypothetical protein